jgi:hypothetical protein
MSGILEHARIITRGLLSNRPKVAERTTDSLAAMRDFLVLRYAKHVNRNVHVGTFSKGGQAQNYAMVPTPGTLLELLHATVQSKVKGAPTPTLPHVILHTSRLGNSLAAD